MTGLFVVVLPVFAVIGLGYLAARLRLIGTAVVDGLSDYMFALAVPALIFSTLSRGALPEESPWGYWIAYFAGVAVVWPLAMLAARRIFGTSPNEAVIHGFCAGQANTVQIGIPLILAAFGDAGAVPMFLLIAIHLPIMMTIAMLMMETADTSGGSRLLRLLKVLVTHPILLSVAAGLLVRTLDMPIPGPVREVVEMLGRSAAPVALVAMGASLARYGFGTRFAPVALISFLKLIVHPLMVWLLATYVLGLSTVFTGVAVLFASLPTGINAFLLAARYKTGEEIASSSISVSTILSIATITFWVWVLGIV